MTTELKYPHKVEWPTVLEALRSGEYNQGRGAMCRHDQGSVEDFPYVEGAYCPLGLINLLAGAEYEIHGTNDEACDQNGETHVPDEAILEGLGLTKEVTADDYENMPQYAMSMQFHFEDAPKRWEVLVYLNDQMGVRFSSIANEIERLGWNGNA